MSGGGVEGSKWIYEQLSSHPSIWLSERRPQSAKPLRHGASDVNAWTPMRRTSRSMRSCTDRTVSLEINECMSDFQEASRAGNPLQERLWVELELRWNHALALGRRA